MSLNGEIFNLCAMDKRFSPHFTSMYFAEWEEAALNKSTKFPLLYYIYLDDILIICPHSKEELWDLFEILNQQDDNINLNTNQGFFKCLVTSDYIYYKLCFKPTGKHQRFTHTIPLKESFNHRYLDFTDIQATNRISVRHVHIYSVI